MWIEWWWIPSTLLPTHRPSNPRRRVLFRAMRVGDYFVLGTEKEASDRKLLCELGVSAVLNVGTPQTLNYFEGDDAYLRYAAVEIFDNRECNFTSVVLRHAIPFMESAVSEGRRTLVHCKTGRSKSPAVMVAWLMVKARLSVLDA